MPRVVSLIASATEIVCSLGFRDHLVGRSHECDFPPDVRALPVCTAPKIDIEASSQDIDRQVKEALRQGLSVYHVDADLLHRLEPDVILTQAHCEVCAVSLSDVEQAMRQWLSARLKLVSLSPNSLADVWTNIEAVAAALGAADRGAELVGKLKARLEEIAERSRLLPRRRVACLEWIEPLMAAGNWVPELAVLAGGRTVLGEPGKHAPWMTFDQLRDTDPDALVVMPCGFDLARTRRELPILERHPGWTTLRAVREGRVFLADGNQFFNRPGPRLVESCEMLAEMLHPETFAFGHQGAGWCQLHES